MKGISLCVLLVGAGEKAACVVALFICCRVNLPCIFPTVLYFNGIPFQLLCGNQA